MTADNHEAVFLMLFFEVEIKQRTVHPLLERDFVKKSTAEAQFSV
jgi:hypothetical protein